MKIDKDKDANVVKYVDEWDCRQAQVDEEGLVRVRLYVVPVFAGVEVAGCLGPCSRAPALVLLVRARGPVLHLGV